MHSNYGDKLVDHFGSSTSFQNHSVKGASPALYCLAALAALAITSTISNESVDDGVVGIGEYSGAKNRDGKRHGKGTYRWTQNTENNANGDIYEGDWIDDKMQGHGYLHNPKGFAYFGDFENDFFHGKGSLKTPSGSYCGEFEHGKMNGRGMFKYADGSAYLGEYKAGKMCGHGVFHFVNGDVYDGEFLASHMHGRGIYTYANGDQFDGEYKNNVMNGFGVMRFADGSVEIEAWWEGGKLHGRGVCSYANGDVYRGSWSHNKTVDSVMFMRGEDALVKGISDESKDDHSDDHTDTSTSCGGAGTIYFGYWQGSKELMLSPGCVQEPDSGESSPVPL